ncbi:hypothetical protein OOZ19_05590 [Saccharopolyspora sp. NFXS83]|uniref:hypothetical protein n=1 Tax=Saccharopolyspora sp. NFXS83 TaxID=2993560 RepID=UPI00224AF746|nr:hypothetical protein [Saccharopolyspora sp. NFXS83]MCX2729702.1 hypothetical protein [Saccharopolyspora sp. NFXS83]
MADGEQLLWLVLPEQGYVGSTVAGRTLVPHSPLSEAVSSNVDTSDWPLPSELVTSGRYLNDEWADDPSIMWWVFADSAERDAIRFGDHLSAVPGEAFLALSSSRLAVIVEQGKLGARQAEQRDETSTGWFGKVRSAAAQVQQAAEGIAALKDAKQPHSCVEVPVSRVAAVNFAPLGRSIPRAPFLRIDFVDGSVLFARHYQAEAHAPKSSGGR